MLFLTETPDPEKIVWMILLLEDNGVATVRPGDDDPPVFFERSVWNDGSGILTPLCAQDGDCGGLIVRKIKDAGPSFLPLEKNGESICEPAV